MFRLLPVFVVSGAAVEPRAHGITVMVSIGAGCLLLALVLLGIISVAQEDRIERTDLERPGDHQRRWDRGPHGYRRL